MDDLCSACSAIIACGVVSHTHSTSYYGNALITYYGESRNGTNVSYTWVPVYDIVLCGNCSETTDLSTNRARLELDGIDSHLDYCCFR